MTQAEKLLLRLAQFPGRLIRVVVYVDSSGSLAFWVVEDDARVEGVKEQKPETEQAFQV